jgi:hypothetical protein
VNQESPTGLEPNNQILAATLEGFDAFTFELGGDRGRLERPDEARIIDLDALEPTADQVRLERETNRLDLGQLGHQAIVSSTMGRGFGAASPTS